MPGEPSRLPPIPGDPRRLPTMPGEARRPPPMPGDPRRLPPIPGEPRRLPEGGSPCLEPGVLGGVPEGSGTSAKPPVEPCLLMGWLPLLGVPCPDGVPCREAETTSALATASAAIPTASSEACSLMTAVARALPTNSEVACYMQFWVRVSCVRSSRYLCSKSSRDKRSDLSCWAMKPTRTRT